MTIGLDMGGSTTTKTSITNSSGSGSQNQNSNTRRLSVDDELYIKDLMKAFGGRTNADLGSARQQAMTDTQGAVSDLFKQFKDTALPNILSAQQRTGGYGATTAQMLSDDAFARTVSSAAGLQLNAINQYETMALNKSQQALSGLSTSLQTLLQANETTTAESSFKSRAKSRTDSMENNFHMDGGLAI